jgi:hypothetical protein
MDLGLRLSVGGGGEEDKWTASVLGFDFVATSQ